MAILLEYPGMSSRGLRLDTNMECYLFVEILVGQLKANLKLPMINFQWLVVHVFIGVGSLQNPKRILNPSFHEKFLFGRVGWRGTILTKSLRLLHTLLACCDIKSLSKWKVTLHWTLTVLFTSLTQLNCGQFQCINVCQWTLENLGRINKQFKLDKYVN